MHRLERDSSLSDLQGWRSITTESIQFFICRTQLIAIKLNLRTQKGACSARRIPKLWVSRCQVNSTYSRVAWKAATNFESNSSGNAFSRPPEVPKCPVVYHAVPLRPSLPVTSSSLKVIRVARTTHVVRTWRLRQYRCFV